MRLDRNQEITRLRAQLSLAERSIGELRADRNAIIEECAQIAEKFDSEAWGDVIAAAIRELKGRP